MLPSNGRSRNSQRQPHVFYNERMQQRQQQRKQPPRTDHQFFNQQTYQQAGFGFTDEGRMIPGPMQNVGRSPKPLRQISTGLMNTSQSKADSTRGAECPNLKPYIPAQNDDNLNVQRSKRHVPVLPECNFESFHRNPCLRLIASRTSFVELCDPMNCVFDEKNRYWIVADRKKGIVFINEDIQVILKVFTYRGLHGPSALVLLDRGDYIGVLDENGILTLEVATGRFTRIVTMHNSRGLGMTLQGDFVTIDSNRQLCFIRYIDNCNDVTRYSLIRTSQVNYEGQPSRPSWLNISPKRIVIADYTLGRVYSYKYDGNTRTLDPQPVVDIDCNFGVAQCRLTGIFLDNRDRMLVTNCKERTISLFDNTGVFLQRVPIEGNFCRSQGLFVNRAGQTMVVDVSSQPHRVALYRLQADPSILHNRQLISRHTQPNRVIAYIDLEKDEEIKTEVMDPAIESSLATASSSMTSSMTSTVSSPHTSPFSNESEASIRPITHEFRYRLTLSDQTQMPG